MKKSLASYVIKKVAPKLGLKVNLEPNYKYAGQIVTPKGKKFYFRNASFDLNPLGAVEIAKDKNYARYFMKKMGYPVPTEDVFFSNYWCEYIGSTKNIDKAYKYAQKIGFPVYVKPNNMSQGTGVTMVFDKREFYDTMKYIFKKIKANVVLVQKPVEGQDYRIIVLDDEVIAAYHRFPLTITGDGKSNIRKLIKDKVDKFIKNSQVLNLKPDDRRVKMNLERRKISLKTILAKGEDLQLLYSSNLSTGGSAVDVTEQLHPSYKKVVIDLTKDMNLRLCGVDLLTTYPIDQPIKKYTILEINASPGVDYYTEIGEKQRDIVENLYEKILRKLIAK